jgi:excinuclease ABC subunit C
MKAFQSSEDMRNATVEELMEIPSMNEQSARAVFAYLHGLNSDDK